MRNSMLIKSFAVVSALGTFAFAPAAMAEEIVSLKGEVMVEKTITENGQAKTVLSPPKSVVPGDFLIFSTAYQNDSAEVVEDFVVTNPLPSAVMLAEDSNAFEVSVDDGATYAALADTIVVDAQGVNRPATTSDVTHIRWTLARLEPGDAGSLKYRGVIR